MVLVTKKQKTPPIHHRKRHGNHHKRDKPYEKTYWPYLPLFAIAGLCLLVNILWTPLSHHVLSYATNTSIAGLLEATNAQRSTNNESTLLLNTQLTAAAQAKATDMANRNYWSHATPDGIEPWQFITNAGYSYQSVGENLAYGFNNSTATITGWMNSAGHRANILNDKFVDVGFGVASALSYQGGDQETIVVAMYGKPGSGSAIIPQATPPSVNGITEKQTAAPISANVSQVAATSSTPPTATTENLGNASAPSNAAAATIATTATPQPSRRIARLELTSTNLPAWSLAALALLTSIAAALLALRHIRYVHRAFVRGERYMLTHPLLDVSLAVVITVGLTLSRTAGFIH